MPNTIKTDSMLRKEQAQEDHAASRVPVQELRSLIRRLRDRADLIAQQINELEWTDQVEEKAIRRKPVACAGMVIVRADRASINIIRQRFLPRNRSVA